MGKKLGEEGEDIQGKYYLIFKKLRKLLKKIFFSCSHVLYEKDGVNYLRMKFYLKGSRRKATVHLEMKENEKKKFEYRYLFVQLDEYPHTTIILEDNRNNLSTVLSDKNDSLSLI